MQNKPISQRYFWLDALRCFLIFCMIIFHLYWDLQHYGFIQKISVMYIIAHIIAASFLFLSGFCYYVSRFNLNSAQRKQKFFYQFFKIFICAILVSISTYIFNKENFIYFGILHNISISYILLYLLEKRPNKDSIFSIFAIIICTLFVPALNLKNHILSYIGLQPNNVRAALDFVPIFPWSAIPILGAISAKFYFKYYNRYPRQNELAKPNTYKKVIEIISKRSLVIYMLHQPIILASFYLIGANNPLLNSCIMNCQANHAKHFCVNYCNCIKDNINLYEDLTQVVRYCSSSPN